MAAVRTFCLTLHRAYRCGNSGACCQKWTVPAEPQVIAVVNARRIRRAGAHGELFVPAVRGHDTSWDVAREADGSCVFFDRDRGRLCVIHSHAGAGALPSACRHFPRKILRDDRGTFVSLSHFCPTAAAMLVTSNPPETVDAHPPLLLDEPIEGLDARGALPPLLRPGMLSDLEGYGAWERASVATFAREDVGWETALDLVSGATERVRGWTPAAGPLIHAVERAFGDAQQSCGTDHQAESRAMRTVRALCADAGVPDDIAPLESSGAARDPLAALSFGPFDTAMKNYLAARVFANWIAYEGRGLRSIVEWLRTCAAVVRHLLVGRCVDSGGNVSRDDFIEAVRQADFLLLHVLDSQAFARRVAVAEGRARQ
jgi:Fe-S-cluster containining protein